MTMLNVSLHPDLLEAITDIHASAWHGVLEEAGTGSWCQTLLQSVSGASHTLVAAHAHYARQAQLNRYGKMARSVSDETVVDWACANLSSEHHFFSLAVSGSVFSHSDQPHGDAHAWIALALSDQRGWTLHVRLLGHERQEQQQALGLLNLYLIQQLARHNTLKIERLPDFLKAQMEIDVWLSWRASESEWYTEAVALVQGQWTPMVLLTPQEQILQPVRYLSLLRGAQILVHKGSFNPPTRAHLAMVQAVLESDQLFRKYQPVLEIALHNADKGFAEQESLIHRLAMLASQPWPVALTRTTTLYQTRALFLEQAQAQNADFVCGEDLYRRVFMKKYYQDLGRGIEEGLERLFQKDCLFWCCGRETELDFSPEAQNHAHAYQNQIHRLDFSLPIASSEIRSAIAHGEKGWREMVTPEVADYIDAHQLYRVLGSV